MVIFGIRAHYSSIGGVENSIRSLLQETSKRNISATLVCGQAAIGERIDCDFPPLSDNVTIIHYKDDVCFSLPRRLFSIMRGGVELKCVYRDLYSKHKDAIIIVRHHSHALAAIHAGFGDVRYLVPSLSKDQLRQEFKDSSLLSRLKTLCHIVVDSFVQERALKACRLFVFSRFMSNRILATLPTISEKTSINIVKPGIDISRFNCPTAAQKLVLRSRLQMPLDKTLILFVGRLVNAKGLDYFIESIVGMPKNCIGIIVGDGKKEQSLRQQIVAMHAEDRFVFAGIHGDVESFYKACDLFVMSSTYEPLGQTIIEAASCGLSIVAFDDGPNVRTATRELDLDFTITYAKSLDSVSLREALNNINSKTNIDRMANSRKSQNLFSWSALLDQLLI